MNTNTSIKKKIFIFSVIFFLSILIIGSIAFIISMRLFIQSSKKTEMLQTMEIERLILDTSVRGEIAIALKMADSFVIQSYFLNPQDTELEEIALKEIAGYRRAFKSNTLFWVSDIDHRFYSDDSYVYTIDPSDPDTYWYLMTLNETESYNFNINYNPDLNVTNLWINAPVFDSLHRPIGILGTGIDISAFIDTIYQNYTGQANIIFFNNLGEITGAKDSTLVAEKKTLNDHFGNTGTEIMNLSRELKNDDVKTFADSIGEIALSRVPVLDWYIAVIMPITIDDYLNNSMTALFFSMIAIIAIIFIVFYLFIGNMLKPLKIMINMLEKISSNWDLTQRLDVRQKDESGTLAEYFNRTFDRMSSLIKDIKNRAFVLSDNSEELKFTMIESSGAVYTIETNIHNMRKMVLAQVDEVGSSIDSLGNIISGLDLLNKNITIQADAVSQSSSSIEEMLANISSVTQTLVKNTANIKSLAESSEAGRMDLQKVSQDIQEIARESEGLLEINSVMQNIASQTNLLSMNAAIEAAHAGESGKGFAVVADEIRKLAENSGKQSKTISAVLKKIKNSIDTITKSTVYVLDRFGVIEREINVVSTQETQIRNAMEEQEVGSRHILDAVMQLNDVTSEVKNSSLEMANISREAMTQSDKLKHLSSNVEEGIDSMTESSEKITNAVTRVQEISQENFDNINILNSEVGKFKVD